MSGQGLGPTEGDACPCHAAQPCRQVLAPPHHSEFQRMVLPLGKDTRPQGRTHGLQLSPFLPLHQQQKSIAAMESEVAALSKSAGLFEVAVPEYKQLKACHREVRLLKQLWDMINLVRAAVCELEEQGHGDVQSKLRVRAGLAPSQG